MPLPPCVLERGRAHTREKGRTLAAFCLLFFLLFLPHCSILARERPPICSAEPFSPAASCRWSLFGTHNMNLPFLYLPRDCVRAFRTRSSETVRVAIHKEGLIRRRQDRNSDKASWKEFYVVLLRTESLIGNAWTWTKSELLFFASEKDYRNKSEPVVRSLFAFCLSRFSC